jgi:hypothetical protein
MLGFELKKTRKILEMLGREVRSKRFALAAFLVPLFIRSIPEILVGPYPIGWDTIAFYVPNTLDWAKNSADWIRMLGNAPLMYIVSVFVYSTLKVSPVVIFKVMGPILYGAMGFALYRLLTAGLRWSNAMAFAGTLVTSLYFTTLRMTWDLYRDTLGLVAVLLAIPLLSGSSSIKRYATLCILILVAVGSNQLTGILMLLLAAASALAALHKGQNGWFTRLLVTSVPGTVLFLAIAYAALVVPSVSPIKDQPPVPTLQALVSSIGFLGYAYLPLAPLIALGVTKVNDPELRVWTILCLVGVLTALFPFAGLFIVSYRWALLLSIPFCVYATAGLSRLAGTSCRAPTFMTLVRGKATPLFLGLLVISAALYIATPAQQSIVYFTVFPNDMPTSMVQNTVPLSDMSDLRILLDWAAMHMTIGTALLAHEAMYGWIRAYLPTTVNVVNYWYSSPLAGVNIAKSLGYSSAVMIWWVNGSGWHGQPTVPRGFVPLKYQGSLAVYQYVWYSETALQVPLVLQSTQT